MKTAVTRRNTLLRSARDQTTYACGMVAVNANYDTSTLLGAGLSLKAEKKPVGKPGAPTNFNAAPGDNEGTVTLSWKRPIRRCTFMVQMQADGESEWKNVENSVPTRCVIEKLKPGAKYWFRVNAVNAHGSGPWTNAIAVRAK